MTDTSYNMVFLVPAAELIDRRCVAEIYGPVCAHRLEQVHGEKYLLPFLRRYSPPCRGSEDDERRRWAAEVGRRLSAALIESAAGRARRWGEPESDESGAR